MTWFFLTLIVWASNQAGPPASPAVELRVYYPTAAACETARQSLLGSVALKLGADPAARGSSLIVCQQETIE